MPDARQQRLADALQGPQPIVTGELRSYTPTFRERIVDALNRNLFGDNREGNQKAEFLTKLGEMSPLGAATSAYDAGRAGTEGNYGAAGLNLLAAIPGFHGSPLHDLKIVKASPPTRQFDNATSALGAYFSPNLGGARRYAGDTGKIYQANVPIERPYEMPWKEFDYFQSPHKLADGSPAQDWGARADELKQEAAALRQRLQQQGYDGVVVRGGRNNDIKEIASFSDVPVTENK